MTPPVNRLVLLVLFAFEAGAITAQTACAALCITPAKLFELETWAAEQGAKLARQRATPARDAGARERVA